MNKTLMVLLLVFFPFTLFSQVLRVELLNLKESFSPGKTHTLVFKVENSNPYSINIGAEITLPENWILVTAINTITLEPKDSKIVLATVDVPSYSPKGMHHIQMQLNDYTHYQREKYDFVLTVNPVQKISLTTLTEANFVKAGDTISSLFLVKNEGNDKEHIRLETSTGSQIIGANSMELAAGSSEVVRVDQKTNLHSPVLFQNLIKLTAFTAYDTLPNIYSYAKTDVIPIYPVAEDVWLRFPIRIAGMYMAQGPIDNLNDGFQGEIYGQGRLNEQNTKFIEFRAVGPNQLGIASYTQYEEYFLNYNTTNFYAHLGDKTFSSSYLTEFSRYGRGAALRKKLGKLEIGGFYVRPHFFKDIKDEINVYTKLDIDDKSAIRYGYLQKRMGENQTQSQVLNPKNHLHYLTANTKFFSFIDLEGEYAISNSSTTHGNAWQFQGLINFTKFNANLNYINASSDFAGYFMGTRFFNANAMYRISPKVTVSANYQKDARNFARDTLFSAAPYRENAQLALSYNYLKRGTISLTAGAQEYEDRMKSKQFFYREKFAKVEWNQEIGYFGMNLQAYLGQTNNFLTHSVGNSSMYTANISFSKQRTNFSVYASYSVVNRYQTVDQKVFLYGGRIHTFISNKFSASVFYQNSYYLEDYFTDRNLFEISLKYALSPRHEIDLISRYTLAQNQLENKDFFGSFRYTLHLNVPIKKTKEYGVLKGNCANLGITSVTGVKLFLGSDVAITDYRGDFVFKNIKPGTYFLEVDKETIDLEDIADVNMPLKMDITEGENIFNFGITKSVSISGTFTLDSNNVAIVTDNNHIESVIIEVLSDSQVYRKIVALSEAFEFNYLRPGDWQVNVYRNGLGKQYKIKTTSFNFRLEAGEKEVIVVELTKQQRDIKYLQEPIKVGYHTKSIKRNER